MAMSILPLQTYQLDLKYFHPITDHIHNLRNVDHIQKHLMVLLACISKRDVLYLTAVSAKSNGLQTSRVCLHFPSVKEDDPGDFKVSVMFCGYG